VQAVRVLPGLRGEKMRTKKARHKTFRVGKGHGVESQGSVLYEPEFTLAQARRICELEDGSNPPEDWEETRKILEREGLLAPLP